MAHTSAADLAHGLKGAHFPLDRKGLVNQARHNKAPHEVVTAIEGMPEKQYASLAEVEHQFSQSSKHAGGSAKAGETPKGGQGSRKQ